MSGEGRGIGEQEGREGRKEGRKEEGSKDNREGERREMRGNKERKRLRIKKANKLITSCVALFRVPLENSQSHSGSTMQILQKF